MAGVAGLVAGLAFTVAEANLVTCVAHIVASANIIWAV